MSGMSPPWKRQPATDAGGGAARGRAALSEYSIGDIARPREPLSTFFRFCLRYRVDKSLSSKGLRR